MAVWAWLFFRGEESIRVVREPGAFVLRVEGPGYEREVHKFKSEAEVGEFQGDYEARLLADGWVLAASQERRAGREGSGAYSGPDRRKPR